MPEARQSLENLLGLAEKKSVVTRAGTWYYFGQQRLGNGVKGSVAYLKEHPDLVEAIRELVGSEPAESQSSGKKKWKAPVTFYSKNRRYNVMLGRGFDREGKPNPPEVVPFFENEAVVTDDSLVQELLEHDKCGIRFWPVDTSVDLPKQTTEYSEGVQSTASTEPRQG